MLRQILLAKSIPPAMRTLEEMIKLGEEINAIDIPDNIVKCSEVFSMQEMTIKPSNKVSIRLSLNSTNYLIIKN